MIYWVVQCSTSLDVLRLVYRERENFEGCNIRIKGQNIFKSIGMCGLEAPLSSCLTVIQHGILSSFY